MKMKNDNWGGARPPARDDDKRFSRWGKDRTPIYINFPAEIARQIKDKAVLHNITITDIVVTSVINSLVADDEE